MRPRPCPPFSVTVSIDDIRDARERIAPSIVRTPFELSETMSALTGLQLYLKFENQQFTASFKERGALNRLLDLTRAQRAQGVIAMSAGNHAQALAYHGRRLGIPTTVVMPRTTPDSKVELAMEPKPGQISARVTAHATGLLTG